MTADLTSYSLVDFIPYTKEVYYSLLTNPSSTHFTLHLFVAALNLVWVRALAQKKFAVQLSCLGLLWFICGFYFYGTLYAQLNWAASVLEWICYTQALCFLLLIPMSVTKKPNARALSPLAIITALMALGLMPLWPVAQAMDWNALSLPGLSSSPLWLLGLSSCLTMPFSKLRYFALLPGLGPVVFSLMRFYVFHLA